MCLESPALKLFPCILMAQGLLSSATSLLFEFFYVIDCSLNDYCPKHVMHAMFRNFKAFDILNNGFTLLAI